MNHQCVDWNESKLGDVIIGNPEYGINAAAEAFDFNKLTYLRITDIDDQGKLLERTLCSISHRQSKDYLLNEGDVVFARTGASVGKTYIHQNPKYPLVFAGFLIKIQPNPNIIVPYFLFLQTQTKKYKNWIVTNSMRSGQPGINSNELKTLPIVLPSLNEQHKIAQALTNADNYISALEKLIEKKMLIKEGLMVNLLTGKQRLKKFAYNEDDSAKGYKDSELGKIPEDWNVGSLGNLTTLKARIGWQGLTVAEYLDQGDYYLVTGTDFNEGFIDFDNCPYVDRSRYLQDTNIQLKTNDVLVTKDGTIGKVAFIENLDLPATLNSGVFFVRPIGSGINSKFLYYILMSKYFDNFLKKITAGSTITHLYQKDFVHFDFVLPTIEEQNLIVNCLSNIDNDLKLLVAKLNKAKNIKQGMMQKLLTGEIRLA